MKKLYTYIAVSYTHLLADCLILGALWIVCSIPVVTMGAATAAVYHAVNKSIVHGPVSYTHLVSSSECGVVPSPR